jgi:hypothetical protein
MIYFPYYMKYIIMHTLQKILEWIFLRTEIITQGRVYSAPLEI